MINGQRVITCSVCGSQMVIPPEYANVQGKCRVCGSIVNAPEDMGGDRTPFRTIGKTSIKKPEKQLTFQAAVAVSVFWGVIGALVAGTLMGAFLFLRSAAGEKVTLKSFMANADTGIVAGFVLCMCFSIIKRLKLSIQSSTLIASGICMTGAIMVHLFEWAFIVQPDQPVWQTAIVGLFGGVVVGVVLGAKVGKGCE